MFSSGSTGRPQSRCSLPRLRAMVTTCPAVNAFIHRQKHVRLAWLILRMKDRGIYKSWKTHSRNRYCCTMSTLRQSRQITWPAATDTNTSTATATAIAAATSFCCMMIFAAPELPRSAVCQSRGVRSASSLERSGPTGSLDGKALSSTQSNRPAPGEQQEQASGSGKGVRSVQKGT